MPDKRSRGVSPSPFTGSSASKANGSASGGAAGGSGTAAKAKPAKSGSSAAGTVLKVTFSLCLLVLLGAAAFNFASTQAVSELRLALDEAVTKDVITKEQHAALLDAVEQRLSDVILPSRTLVYPESFYPFPTSEREWPRPVRGPQELELLCRDWDVARQERAEAEAEIKRVVDQQAARQAAAAVAPQGGPEAAGAGAGAADRGQRISMPVNVRRDDGSINAVSLDFFAGDDSWAVAQTFCAAHVVDNTNCIKLRDAMVERGARATGPGYDA